MEYFGTKLDREPVNQPFATIAWAFDNGRRVSQYVHLEPGDGTRYDFTVTRLGPQTFWVTRYVGQELLGSVFVNPLMTFEQLEEAFARSFKNEWTAKMFAWWMTEFFDEVIR